MDSRHLGAVADAVGDTPFTVSPYFFVCRGDCAVLVDDATRLGWLVVVPGVSRADSYILVRRSLAVDELDGLADLVASLESRRLFVPECLVQPVRTRRRVLLEAEGLCFTCRCVPADFTVARQVARRLSRADAAAVAGLPGEATFLHLNYHTPEALLSQGLAFGIFCGGRLVSLAASLALTPQHCDVGVYTLPRYRNLGYATDCVRAILAESFARGLRPLWRIGIRQRLAIYFAEKLGMEEIGANGREIYLELACRG
ncbi:MAG: GNAT family N-acetyltransferase [Chloroflexota bacterium]